MNNINQYLFNIYHFLVHMRDTLEYTVPKAHELQVYEAHKNVLSTGYKPNSPLGNWIRDNEKQGQELTTKIDELMSELYSDDSAIIKVTNGEIRVDNTQNIRIFELVYNTTEILRNIIFGYLGYARSQKAQEEDVEKLIVVDDRFSRTLFAMLAIRELEKSFAEFQKVVEEAKGQRTPQANFIVQNEINKMATLIRENRAHCHCIDNETLDILDDVNKLLEMVEGRRERRDNKSFKDLFQEINARLSAYYNKLQPVWQSMYKEKLDFMIELSKKNAANQQA